MRFSLSAIVSGALSLFFFHLATSGGQFERHQHPHLTPKSHRMSVADFLPRGYLKDGSVRYQSHIQKAIDAAAKDGRTLVFPPMIYRLDETGLQLRSNLTLSMYGAVFQFDGKRKNDGHAFFGRDITNVNIFGCEIAGQNHLWPEGTNIRGIYITGKSNNIRIRDLHIHDLSSNGIGLFGSPDHLIRDVWVTDVVIENCCNKYGDYLSSKVGPEKGSDRKDQGSIAFYHVQDFVVRGCRLEKSRSDGTHFYKCKQGQFVHNKVYSAQMGGYFIETCDDVLASDNIIRDNGSRGVTIERGSTNCTLTGNVVANSGREGLWAPDCTGLIITSNLFKYNGRKPNGKKPTQIWNANITINEAAGDPTKSPTEDYLIANNMLYTSAGQIAAIRIDANKTTSGIVVKDNVLRGENHKILVQGDQARKAVVKDND